KSNGHGYPFRDLSHLRPGDHLCCIFRSAQEHRAVLTRFLRDGLEKGEKVVYVYDCTTPETIKNYLRDDGIAVAAHLDRGQLVFMSAADSYLRHNVFRPEEMLDFWKVELARAQAE